MLGPYCDKYLSLLNRLLISDHIKLPVTLFVMTLSSAANGILSKLKVQTQRYIKQGTERFTDLGKQNLPMVVRI